MDEPSGSNDGTVKGARKFDCPDKFGAFVRGANIAVGDYPERDIFADSDEEGESGNSAAHNHDHSHAPTFRFFSRQFPKAEKPTDRRLYDTWRHVVKVNIKPT